MTSPADPMGLSSSPGLAENDRELDSRSTRRVLLATRVMLGLVAIGMFGLLCRVIQLQAFPPKPIAGLIGSQNGGTSLQARRGNLLDRRGRVFAATKAAKRLFVDPSMLKDPAVFVNQFSSAIGCEPAWLDNKINHRPGSRYVVIADRLSDAQAGAVEALKFPGVGTEPMLVRDYPQGSLAGQVIGFMGSEGKGLEGIELTVDSRVSGRPGRIDCLRDARRNPLWIEGDQYQPPADGQPIRLTLDLVIQQIAETVLQEACEKFNAEGGQLIVMDPYTGEILAMANSPTFDPNQFSQYKPEQRRNRCVSDVFEPGSTFKPFIWAFATQTGAARPNEVIDCGTSGAYVTPEGRRLHDMHPHGRLTWEQVLVKSSNIGMAIVGQRMGPERLHAAVRGFGFGTTTGSRLPGESSGLVTPFAKWTHYTVTSVPMGQEIAVTPLQLLTAFSVFANNGFRVTPSIVCRTNNPNEARYASAPIFEQVLTPQTAIATRGVLRRVVSEGTAQRANSPMYTIFGKTGTAQLADRVHGGYLQDQYISSFIGGAPTDRPVIVVSCIIHQPEKAKGYQGGTVAAPAVRAVIEQTLQYLGVQPVQPIEQQLVSNAVRR
jgi:cell division protein FtsI/penicillin-binding protein 2